MVPPAGEDSATGDGVVAAEKDGDAKGLETDVDPFAARIFERDT